MCLATAAVIAGIAGAGIGAAGQIEGGAAASNAANYSAQVASNNATIATQNAAYTEAAGSQKAATSSLKGAATGGRIKTAQAANGVDVNTGSNVDVQVSQREGAKLDTEQEWLNSLLEARGLRAQASNFQAQSGLDKLQGAQATEGADIGATGSLLSSASGLGLKWSQLGPTAGAGSLGNPGGTGGGLGGLY